MVENALFHAEHLKHELLIRVFCEQDGKQFRIHVSDNGCGGDAELLNRKLKMDKTEGVYGIGIRNVNKRIQMIAGEDYGIHYEQLGDGGLDAIITIPLRFE